MKSLASLKISTVVERPIAPAECFAVMRRRVADQVLDPLKLGVLRTWSRLSAVPRSRERSANRGRPSRRSTNANCGVRLVIPRREQ
jgi:hypothetical protein